MHSCIKLLLLYLHFCSYVLTSALLFDYSLQITIPADATTYWCHGFRLPEEIRKEEKHMIRVCTFTAYSFTADSHLPTQDGSHLVYHAHNYSLLLIYYIIFDPALHLCLFVIITILDVQPVALILTHYTCHLYNYVAVCFCHNWSMSLFVYYTIHCCPLCSLSPLSTSRLHPTSTTSSSTSAVLMWNSPTSLMSS